MCRHKILAHNNHGYVIFCKGCGKYQLAFGTSLVTLSPEDFQRFCSHLSGLKKKTAITGFEHEKQIGVDIYSKHSMMVLNYQELQRLNALLDEANFTREIEFLLQESHIKSQGN
jgi:hypothetical protein